MTFCGTEAGHGWPILPQPALSVRPVAVMIVNDHATHGSWPITSDAVCTECGLHCPVSQVTEVMIPAVIPGRDGTG